MASDPDTAAFFLATQDMSLCLHHIWSVVMDYEFIFYDGLKL